MARKHHTGWPVLTWLLFAVVIGFMTVGGIAVATAADCGLEGSQQWEWFPPGWTCAP